MKHNIFTHSKHVMSSINNGNVKCHVVRKKAKEIEHTTKYYTKT